ncbi:hypothetical protein Rwratislav_45116, partial [Rhodococcus wratislaviensis IFP 2016]
MTTSRVSGLRHFLQRLGYGYCEVSGYGEYFRSQWGETHRMVSMSTNQELATEFSFESPYLDCQRGRCDSDGARCGVDSPVFGRRDEALKSLTSVWADQCRPDQGRS